MGGGGATVIYCSGDKLGGEKAKQQHWKYKVLRRCEHRDNHSGNPPLNADGRGAVHFSSNSFLRLFIRGALNASLYLFPAEGRRLRGARILLSLFCYPLSLSLSPSRSLSFSKKSCSRRGVLPDGLFLRVENRESIASLPGRVLLSSITA